LSCTKGNLTSNPEGKRQLGQEGGKKKKYVVKKNLSRGGKKTLQTKSFGRGKKKKKKSRRPFAKRNGENGGVRCCKKKEVRVSFRVNVQITKRGSMGRSRERPS